MIRIRPVEPGDAGRRRWLRVALWRDGSREDPAAEPQIRGFAEFSCHAGRRVRVDMNAVRLDPAEDPTFFLEPPRAE